MHTHTFCTPQDGPLAHYPSFSMVDPRIKWQRIQDWAASDSVGATSGPQDGQLQQQQQIIDDSSSPTGITPSVDSSMLDIDIERSLAASGRRPTPATAAASFLKLQLPKQLQQQHFQSGVSALNFDSVTHRPTLKPQPGKGLTYSTAQTGVAQDRLMGSGSEGGAAQRQDPSSEMHRDPVGNVLNLLQPSTARISQSTFASHISPSGPAVGGAGAATASAHVAAAVAAVTGGGGSRNVAAAAPAAVKEGFAFKDPGLGPGFRQGSAVSYAAQLVEVS